MSETDAAQRRPTELTVPPESVGERVDVVLASTFSEYSRSFFQRGIRSKRILLNSQPCRPADTLRAGDRLTVQWPRTPRVTIAAEELDLDVLDEDDDVIVLSKPAGLVVHPAKGNQTGTLVHGLLYHDEEHFTELLTAGNVRPGIVHRLDKDTSGVMVVAKNERSRFALSNAFRDRNVEKTYLAIVVGEFGAKTGRIEGDIGRHPVNRKKMAVIPEGGKRAVTLYRVLGTNEDLTLVEVRILTGRTHQIRVHFAHLRHPVLGDDLYGGRQRDLDVPAERQMLHAWKLTFPHPASGLMREYMAPIPNDFRAALQAAGLPVVGAPYEHDQSALENMEYGNEIE